MRRILPLALVIACSSSASPPTRAVRLVHTFNPVETAALDDYLATRRTPVETALLPFARGQSVLHELLKSDVDCPDVVRIDATWLPGLVDDGLLLPAPPARARDWLPEAAELASYRGTAWALPHSLDGLAVVSRAPAPTGGGGVAPRAQPEGSSAGATPAAAGPPTDNLDELEAWARAQTHDGRWGLGLRVDGYWLVAWLRAGGADVADGTTGALGIDGDGAVAAVTRFAADVAQVSPPPPPPGDEAAAETRRFRAGELAALVTGPWALPDLAPDLAGVGVAALPGAPRGGQLLVVPKCARDPDGGWQLASELTDPTLTAAWSRRTGMIPATVSGLAGGSDLSRAFHDALAGARPLPRSPVSAWVFDDLNPALAAVVAGDATADEAVAGVRRAWARLLRRGS